MERRLRSTGARRKLMAGTVAVLAVGGGLLALGPAAASGSTHASEISLHYNTAGTAFQGHVTSDTADCEIGRSVILYLRTTGGTTAVGSAHTNFHGFYRIAYPESPGAYYVVTRQSMLPGYSNTVCEKAKSFFRVIS